MNVETTIMYIMGCVISFLAGMLIEKGLRGQ